MELKNTESHIISFDLYKERAVNFASEFFFFNLSWICLGFRIKHVYVFCLLVKSFCEVYDKQYGEVEISI